MTALTTSDFRQAMAEHAAAVVVFAGGAVGGEVALAALRGPESGRWFWAWVDVTASPEIAAMFGIAGDPPAVVVMREEVVLSESRQRCRKCPRESQAALFARRVCPTARR